MLSHNLIATHAVYARSLLWRLSGLAALCLAVEAVAQDALIIKTNFFSVSGASEREIRRSINQARPWKDKLEGDAKTDWKIEWTFKLMASGSECQIHSFATKASITITLPKWTPPAAAPETLMQRWESYLAALKIHEEGHKQIALAAAAEVQKRVRALKREATCEALSESMNSTAKGVIAEYRQKEVEYDQKTDHGATQGARFP